MLIWGTKVSWTPSHGLLFTKVHLDPIPYVVVFHLFDCTYSSLSSVIFQDPISFFSTIPLFFHVVVAFLHACFFCSTAPRDYMST
jgi:hypothetical protein